MNPFSNTHASSLQSYNIGFLNADGIEDETQFDVHPATVTKGLINLFYDFCQENHCKPHVLYVEKAS